MTKINVVESFLSLFFFLSVEKIKAHKWFGGENLLLLSANQTPAEKNLLTESISPHASVSLDDGPLLCCRCDSVPWTRRRRPFRSESGRRWGRWAEVGGRRSGDVKAGEVTSDRG